MPGENYQQLREREGTQDSIDRLFSSKGLLLRTKLEVLAVELRERWCVLDRNQASITTSEDALRSLVNVLTAQARYHVRERADNRPFYQMLFDLDKERRDQELECWRDVVEVMRDFMAVWEAHEQAKARALLLSDA